MSVHQVEEFYIYFEDGKFDLAILKALCDDEGLDFEVGSNVVEGFECESDAYNFENKLIENALIFKGEIK